MKIQLRQLLSDILPKAKITKTQTYKSIKQYMTKEEILSVYNLICER